jgi:hypothetical protein
MSNSPTSPTCSWNLLPEFSDMLPSPETSIPSTDNRTSLRTQILTENWEWKQRPSNNTDPVVALSSNEGWTSTTVPTEIFKDVLAAGKIPDPHLDENEKEVQWVGHADWLYRTKFLLAAIPRPGDKIEMVFEGLDTFATVYLDGQMILKTEVFPRWGLGVDGRICFWSIGLILRSISTLIRRLWGYCLNRRLNGDERKWQNGGSWFVGMVRLLDFMYGKHSIIGDGIGVSVVMIIVDDRSYKHVLWTVETNSYRNISSSNRGNRYSIHNLRRPLNGNAKLYHHHHLPPAKHHPRTRTSRTLSQQHNLQ